MNEIVWLGAAEREPTETWPTMTPLDIVAHPGRGWDYARRLGGYPELEWSYSLLTERSWMLSSQVQALFYEELSSFDRVREAAGLSHDLREEGHAGPHVGVGFRYFDRFYRTTTGRLELPGPDERLRGRHWVGIRAPLSADELFYRNTWGPDWGDRGHGRLGRDYFEAHVTTATVNWNSDTGPSRRMVDCLEAPRGGGSRREDWLACWPTRNEFLVEEVLIDGVPHSTVSWEVRSLETLRPVYVVELRNPRRVVGRLHLHAPADKGTTYSIRELFVVPARRRRGLGTLLESIAVEQAFALGATHLEAWVHASDNLPRTSPTARGFAAARGYETEPLDHPHLDVTAIARKELEG